MDKVDIIRELIRLGKVKVVLEFVEGDSVYISDASEGCRSIQILEEFGL